MVQKIASKLILFNFHLYLFMAVRLLIEGNMCEFPGNVWPSVG